MVPYFLKSIFNQFVLINLLILAVRSSEKKSLHCHKCISIACEKDPEICLKAKEFILSQIENYHYVDAIGLPNCPDSSNLLAWESLGTEVPSSIPCGEAAPGLATCVLGRFQIKTHVTDLSLNITTHGTVMGCAKKGLLDNIRSTAQNQVTGTAQKNPYNKKVTGCHSDYSKSSLHNSLQHFLEIEHCLRLSDMCYTQDFCLHPKYSAVRSFKEVDYYDNTQSTHFLNTLIWIFVVIGILIAVLSFFGIKYG